MSPKRSVASQDDTPAHKCPVEDCSLMIDAIIRCSDGQHFGTHVQNLEAFSREFRPSRKSARSKKDTLPSINATERGAIIGMLLRFMHNTPHPELKDVPLQDVLDLNVAGRRYVIHSAISASQKAMNEQALDQKRGSYAARTRVLLHKLHNKEDSDIDHIMRRMFYDNLEVEEGKCSEPDELGDFVGQFYDEYNAFKRYRESWDLWNLFSSGDMIEGVRNRQCKNGRYYPRSDDGVNVWGVFDELQELPSVDGFKRGFQMIKFWAPQLGDGRLEAYTDWEEKIEKIFEREPSWKTFMPKD
ncbi:hypothetical protein VNI00_014570 [Paramarasmius palmivorus]|uniref:Uncharacterized protein n=1 Tax=Paramarasmius palmivorus TaxID=297713 RepID=A0AAW0BRD9_9AGAR